MKKCILKKLCIVTISSLILSGCSPDKLLETTSDKTFSNENLMETSIKIKTDNDRNSKEVIPVALGVIGDDRILYKGELTQIVANAIYTSNEIEMYKNDYDNTKGKSDFSDYTKALIIKGVISDVDFKEDEEVLLKDIEALLGGLEAFEDEEIGYSVGLTEENQNSQISYGFFTSIFVKTLNSIATNNESNIYDRYGVSSQEETILATRKENKEIPEGYVLTDYGVRDCGDLDFSYLLNCSVNLLLKGDRVVLASSVVSLTPTIYSALILGNDEDTISIFTGGVNRIFKIDSGISEDLSGKLCNVKIDGDFASEITVLENEISEEVVAEESDKLVFENSGEYQPKVDTHSLKIYDVTGDTPKFLTGDDIYVGENNIVYVISENKVVGGKKIANINEDKIRIAISTTNFESKYHDSVTLVGDLNVNGETFLEYEANVSNFSPYEVVKVTSNSNSEIGIKSIERNVKNSIPYYNGSIEIMRVDDSLVVVNETDISSYLKKVVPSEMPSSYEIEALKAQAVSARTYAYKQKAQRSFQEIGAYIDDSVLSQVYNNISTQESTDSAVETTAGEVLTHNGNLITANFFSTSSGFTSNSGEVWGDSTKRIFPSDSPTYLTSVSLIDDKIDFDEDFDYLDYFKNIQEKALEKDFQWFRWNSKISFAEIENNLNNYLKNRMSTVPYMFEINKAFDGDFGEVTNIEILTRSESGLVLSLGITSEKYDLVVKGEYNIRKMLSPENTTVTCQDKSVVSNYSLLPSAYIAFEKDDESLYIYGGGNGHGVGMSQNGAKAMAMDGMNYKEILESFYIGCEIVER